MDTASKKKRVLVVVEDEPDIRLMVRMALSSEPALELCGEAATAEEAIELARTTQPDLIILDNFLEGQMTGLQAAPILKEAAPAARILLFSSRDLTGPANREPAIDAFLMKTHFADLLPTVRRLLALETGITPPQ